MDNHLIDQLECSRSWHSTRKSGKKNLTSKNCYWFDQLGQRDQNRLTWVTNSINYGAYQHNEEFKTKLASWNTIIRKLNQKVVLNIFKTNWPDSSATLVRAGYRHIISWFCAKPWLDTNSLYSFDHNSAHTYSQKITIWKIHVKSYNSSVIRLIDWLTFYVLNFITYGTQHVLGSLSLPN